MASSEQLSKEQIGAGPSLLENRDFVTKIADLVAKRISQPAIKFRPSDPNWRPYENTEPTVTSEVQQDNIAPPISFSNPIYQNDMNDSFDESALLKKVPKAFKKRAQILLKIFDERPHELTWDSSGNIYVNEQSIPNANIFLLFPYLFRKRVPKSVVGLPDLVAQLKSMGLSHLINCHAEMKPKKPQPSEPVPKASSSSDWWYLGS